MRRSTALLLPAMALLLGCPRGPPMRSAVSMELGERPRPPVTDEAEPEPDSALVEPMHERFELVRRLQRALVDGDLGGAQALGVELGGRLREEPSPAAWQPHLEALQAELAQLARAEELPAAAGAVARMGLGCGRCHEEQAITLELPDEPAPQPAGDLESTMQVHRWAVDRMWEGLVAPSHDRWIRGTTMFTVIPGCEETMAQRGEEQRARCQRAQDLARRGHVAPDPAARAEIYGKVLVTCAGCHLAHGASGSSETTR